MAAIHDVMPVFELFQPTSIEETLVLLDRYGSQAWVMAGGMDTFDWLKDRIKRPTHLIDLSQVSELRGVRVEDDYVEIGATTTLTEIERHPVIRDDLTLLASAAGLVASPQIRNQGTIGGNVSQDTRCWYYRSGWSCYRAGGNICYADTPTAINREHAILDADRCVAVNPSDTAPALIALDAKMMIRSTRAEWVVDAEDYFIGPDIDITRMNVLRPDQLLTAIRIPMMWAGARFYFEKVRDRNVWDFPLVNVASAIKLSGSTIRQMRLAVGAVAARPLRLVEVEQVATGRLADDETAAVAGDAAVRGAQPLRYNAYKIPLLRNLVRRAIRNSVPATT